MTKTPHLHIRMIVQRASTITFCFCVVLHTVTSSTLPSDDPDVGLNTVQMIENHNYVCESHTIITQDGYILTYHRIPNGKPKNASKKSPVLLMHGATASSADYVNMGPNRSLGYILADRGYDVWLANARGNVWARNHTRINNAEEFFDFSWHEMGYYDLPAAIDYILETTNSDNLFYIGHSVGTTAFLVLATTRPEYNQKIKLVSLMAPIAMIENQTNGVLLIMARFIYTMEALAKFLGIYEVPYVDEIRKFGVEFCSQAMFYPLCEAIIFVIVGRDKEEFDPSKIAVLLSNTPSNAALKQFYHSGQLIKNGGFSQFDHGKVKNMEIYGTEQPPPYNISKISAPVALYYGKNDIVVNVKDVEQLIKKISNVAKNYLVPYEYFNHFDFLYAIDVVDLLYEEVMQLMEQYQSTE